jgi:predicted PurR-regulated permease PerM
VAAGWSWRLLVIAAVMVLVAWAAGELRLVTLPLFLALLAAALLRPPAARLERAGAPPALAATAVMVGAIAALTGIATLLAPTLAEELGQLGTDLREGIDEIANWITEGPLGLSEGELDDWIDDGVEALRDRREAIAGGAVSGALLVTEAVAGLLLTIVFTFFFVKDGDRIWAAIVDFAPERRRADLREIGARSWETLAGYLRGVTAVALFDAVFIGVALVLLGVPAALPLAVLVFFGAYIPIAGAVVTGFAAVLVALVANGVGTAALVLAAVIAVQQIEGNVLQPVVVGHAVSLHPVAILSAVTVGGVLAGIAGAFVAVPLAAVAARVGGYLRERGTEAGAPAAPPAPAQPRAG